MSIFKFFKSLVGIREPNLTNTLPQENINLEEKPKNINIKQDEDHSWDFLYDITEKVENNFSTQDNEDIINLGKTMDKIGIVYYHVVD